MLTGFEFSKGEFRWRSTCGLRIRRA